LALTLGAASLAACQPKTTAVDGAPKSAPVAPSASASAAVALMASSSEMREDDRSLVGRIGENYTWLSRADGLFWAPFNCLAPPPADAYLSRSSAGAHARKLYNVLLQDPVAYASATKSSLQRPLFAPGTHHAPYADAGPDATTPQGPPRTWQVFLETSQVVVKESWAPTPCASGDGNGQIIGGTRYCLKTRGPLFVMARPRKPSGPTDDGWIYGTVVDGQVTAAGLMESCLGCHVKAPHGRLFGLPKAQ